MNTISAVSSPIRALVYNAPAESANANPCNDTFQSSCKLPSFLEKPGVRAQLLSTTARLNYNNPVIAHDAPDPGVVQAENKWWMATTGGDPQNGAFPFYSSVDMIHWEPAKTKTLFAPGLAPAWSRGDYWAPEIHKVGDQFVAYFTARHEDGRLRVGAATADKIEGPYTDIGEPLVTHPRMGVIDATFFRDDDGKQYLYWKEDGNDVGEPSRLMAAELSADGLRLTGEPVEVLRNDPDSWEGTVVEGPELIKRDGTYYLFYAGNGYGGHLYAEGVARSSSPLGPFEKSPQPFLRSNQEWAGPGHAAFTKDANGTDWMVYHAWDADHIGQAPGRLILIDRLEWGPDRWPYVNGPSYWPTPGPSTFNSPAINGR